MLNPECNNEFIEFRRKNTESFPDKDHFPGESDCGHSIDKKAFSSVSHRKSDEVLVQHGHKRRQGW